jgi:hypothetical protein
MEASGAEQGRTHWHHWLLWWKIDRAALQREINGYETLGLLSARAAAALVPTAGGIWQAIIGGYMLWVVNGLATELRGYVDFVHEAGVAGPVIGGSLMLVAGLLLAVLSVAVYLGSEAAIRGMMVLWTLDILLVSILGLPYVQHHMARDVMVVGVPMAWAAYMHMLTIALRVEQCRSRMPGHDAIASASC